MAEIRFGSSKEIEQGFKNSDKYISSSCVKDTYMKQWIEDNAVKNTTCSYSGKKAPCVSMNKFLQKIMDVIGIYYSKPADEDVYYDVKTAKYEIDTWDTESVLLEINKELQADDNLINDMIELVFDRDWCSRNAYGVSEYERKEYSWEHFSNLVKYESRYFFFADDESPLYGRLSPINILEEIASEAKKMNCIKTLDTGSIFYRAHILNDDDNFEFTDSRLGSPPSKFAQINRMSDAGISVFYAADSVDTAIKEVVECNTKKVVVAEFKNLEQIRYLDLTDIDKLSVPSYFDTAKRYEREKTLFLKTINSELTRTIDEQENIEYVPTQIFAEYYRAVEKVDGIKYSSAQDRNGSCFVLFFNNEQCCKPVKPATLRKQKLDLAEYKIYRLNIKFDYSEIKHNKIQ